jgi:hypothetical protein
MEVTCSRCRQTVQPEDCFCPFCGLPQLVYTADGSAGPGVSERTGEPVGDAGTVDWKAALRLALMLAIPARRDLFDVLPGIASSWDCR